MKLHLNMTSAIVNYLNSCYFSLALLYFNMKKLFSLILLAFSLGAHAQNEPSDYSTRSTLHTWLAPFFHGVASGDPLTDRVILWTRITIETPVDPISVQWKIATDTLLTNVVNSGTVTTDVSKDYTVKVDATGLQPNTWYYYAFTHNGKTSLTGRTRTLPVGNNVDSLRIGVVSCQDYENGFYNAYNHMAKRNDMDVIFHLGDFIYEYGAESTLGRDHEPAHEIISLSDYRIRHSQYKLDDDLRAAMQQYPFICIWDDHETANDAYKDGADNHTPGTEGNYSDRKSYSTKAYSEWMPIRMPDPNNLEKIYRQFVWGDLAESYFLESRLLARDEQVGGAGTVSVNDPAVNDTNRRMLGMEQMGWLKNGLSNSSAQWQIIAQQVMMAPLLVNIPFTSISNIANTDQWDGYPAERKRLYDHIMGNNIDNVVVLTGDIHTSWANDLPLPNYSNGNNSVGVEFVGTSITSNSFLNLPVTGLITNANPHIKWVDLHQHGYMIVDVNRQRVQNDWYFVSTIDNTNYTLNCGKSYYVNQGERKLNLGTGCVTQTRQYPPLAPQPIANASIAESGLDNVLVFSVYPNPFMEQVVVQFHLMEQDDLTLEIVDMTGKKVYSSFLGKIQKGLQYAHFDGTNLSKGQYIVTLKGRKESVGKMILKVD